MKIVAALWLTLHMTPGAAPVHGRTLLTAVTRQGAAP